MLLDNCLGLAAVLERKERHSNSGFEFWVPFLEISVNANAWKKEIVTIREGVNTYHDNNHRERGGNQAVMLHMNLSRGKY